jgi:hypothetical protein
MKTNLAHLDNADCGDKVLALLTTTGLCSKSETPEIWTTEKPNHSDQAIKICNKCPVVSECHSYAKSKSMTAGVWGGVRMWKREIDIFPYQITNIKGLKPCRLIRFNGKTQNLTEWSKELGASRYLVSKRLSWGWSIEEALTTLKHKRSYK